MNNAIGGWNITILNHSTANMDSPLMISSNSYGPSTERLDAIGKRPGGGTHTRTAKGLCNRNIQIYECRQFDITRIKLESLACSYALL